MHFWLSSCVCMCYHLLLIISEPPKHITECQHLLSGLSAHFQKAATSSFYFLKGICDWRGCFDCLHLFSTIFTQVQVLLLIFSFFLYHFQLFSFIFHHFNSFFITLTCISSLSTIMAHFWPLLIFNHFQWFTITFKLYSQIQTCFQLLLFIFDCYLDFWFLQCVIYLFLKESFINYRY